MLLNPLPIPSFLQYPINPSVVSPTGALDLNLQRLNSLQTDVFELQSPKERARAGNNDFNAYQIGMVVGAVATFVLMTIYNWDQKMRLREVLSEYDRETRTDNRKTLNNKFFEKKPSESVALDFPNNASNVDTSAQKTETTIRKTVFSLNPVRHTRVGSLEKILDLSSRSGITSSIAGGSPYLVIATKMAEFMIKEVLSTASTVMDTPKFFEAFKQLEHAKTLLDDHTGGFDNMSPKLQQGYRGTLDRATTLFREASGTLKDEAKLLTPIYSLHEVATLLLNGNREEALSVANRAKREYQAQKPTWDKLHYKYWDATDIDEKNVFARGMGGVVNIGFTIGSIADPLLGMIVPIFTDNHREDHMGRYAEQTFEIAYKPHLLTLYKRIKPFYENTANSTHVENSATKLANLPPNDTVFKLLPPKP